MFSCCTILLLLHAFCHFTFAVICCIVDFRDQSHILPVWDDMDNILQPLFQKKDELLLFDFSWGHPGSQRNILNCVFQTLQTLFSPSILGFRSSIFPLNVTDRKCLVWHHGQRPPVKWLEQWTVYLLTNLCRVQLKCLKYLIRLTK